MIRFHWILILTCMVNFTIEESTLKCMDTTCFCEDYGPIILQCPKGNNDEIEIRIERNQEITMSCKNQNSQDHNIPKYAFNPNTLTFENCSISNQTAKTFNITNVEILKIQDSIFKKGNVLFEETFPRLKRLVLRNINLENSTYQRIKAPKLKYVEINKLSLSSVTNIVSNLTQIENLDLINIGSIKIHANIFPNSSNLLELQMSSNSIEKFHGDAFKNLKNLTTLNLDNNNIKNISKEVLRPLQSLIHINLDSNPGIQLDEYLLSNFSELSTVHLRSSRISLIPENIFRGSTNISEISLECNEISILPVSIFDGLENLKILNLNDNKLTKLRTVFKDLVSLRKLNLDNNQITSLRAGNFRDLMNLKELSMNHNEIAVIGEFVFEFTPSLEKLHLSHNQYKYEVLPGYFYTKTPFSKCNLLKYLDLGYNFFKDVPNDLHIFVKSLKYLNLEGNPIEYCDLEEIRNYNFKELIINMKNTNITYFSKIEKEDPDYIEDDLPVDSHKIQISISGIPFKCDCRALTLTYFVKEEPGFFIDLPDLKCAAPSIMKNKNFEDVHESELMCDLHLESGGFECVPSENCTCLWRPFDRTVIVNCSSSNLTEVPALDLSLDLPYEKIEVRLDNNRLTEFDEVEGYENVTSLFLANNTMENLFWIPSKIEVIDISHNNLTSLNGSILEILSLQTVKNITLGNNKWSCGCDSYNMKNFVLGNIKKIDAENVKCSSSELTMYSITEEQMCSHSNFILIFLIFLILTLLIFSVIYYKYELQIKIWLYNRNLCMRFLVEDDLDKNKEYDVFVSYSHKDSEFVEKGLVPILEKAPFCFKLCLHYRDWTPGSFITQNIANSVAKSRRTLIVLTPNFLNSIWGKLEFRTAHAEAMAEKRNRVILLLKEDIDVESLDDELKSYISTNTYLKWGDNWFWKKLRYALPHKQREELKEIKVNPHFQRNFQKMRRYRPRREINN